MVMDMCINGGVIAHRFSRVIYDITVTIQKVHVLIIQNIIVLLIILKDGVGL
jgi:hypothetical protein